MSLLLKPAALDVGADSSIDLSTPNASSSRFRSCAAAEKITATEAIRWRWQQRSLFAFLIRDELLFKTFNAGATGFA